MHSTVVNVTSSHVAAVEPQSDAHVSEVPEPPLKTHPFCVLGSYVTSNVWPQAASGGVLGPHGGAELHASTNTTSKAFTEVRLYHMRAVTRIIS